MRAMPTEHASGGGDDPRLVESLERLGRGDLSARDTIIELCAERLRRLAHRMLARFPNVHRWDDTDDVFQNAAVRLHRALGQMTVETPRSLMGLAATQIHRELIDLARRHAGPASFAANHATRLGPTDPSAGGPATPVANAPAPSEPPDRWTLFHEAIAALPGELREVFQMVWYLEADQKTIARLLGCSERTVKSRWRAARQSIHAALDGQPPE
ncbi:MAG: sigma-70 family RNA polymerase sigma factor [Planctomycetes bacterium]|nr:sigma-70 family RNA polymerase sigma factor [Planctomycetota bacterium]